MQLIKPMEQYYNYLDVAKNQSLNKIVKQYKKSTDGFNKYFPDTESKEKMIQKIGEMLRISTALSLYGELLFFNKIVDEDEEKEWHDFLVLSARNYQKIIEILEINKIEEKIISNDVKYQLMLMSLLEFHNGRRHAIASSISQKVFNMLEDIENNFNNKKIDLETVNLHKCIIYFLKADFYSCTNIAENIYIKIINEIGDKDYQEIFEIYDSISILYILKSLISIVNYLEKGKNEKLEQSFYFINEAIKYADASKRIDLCYFSNKLNISYKILSELSIWNIRGLFKFEKTSSKKALYEYIRIKIEDRRYFMFTSQFNALFKEKILEKRKNSLISIPTGAGKTFLAEILILQRLLTLRYEEENNEGIIVYLVPSRALAREKFEDFTKAFDGKKKLKFNTCQITGEIVLNADEAIKKNDIAIMTQEKFDMILREEFFGVGIDTLIVDEFHNIRTGYRGLKLQFAIIRFKNLPAFKKSKIFLISAIVKEKNFYEIGEWIYAENLFQTDWRPTFTRIGIISLDDPDKLIKFNDGITIDSKMPSEIKSTHTNKAAIWLTLKFAKKEPVLLFSTYVTNPHNKKNHLLELAEKFSQSEIEITRDNSANKKYSEKLKRIVGNEEIYKFFKKGIGVHWGSLPHPVRKIMENAVNDKAIGIIISTTTLAEGVNLPIKTVVIPRLTIQDELMDFGLFFNLIGRAGRPFKHAEGQIILIANDKGRNKNQLKDVKKYYSAIRDDIEDIKSPIHLIFKLRDEIIPKYEEIYKNKSNRTNFERLEEKKKELNVHIANLESVMLAMIAEKLIPNITNNNELLKKITIGESNHTEMEKISSILSDIEKRLVNDYSVIHYSSNNNRLIITDFGRTVYLTGFSPKTCLEIYTKLKDIAMDIHNLNFYPNNLKYKKINRDYFTFLVSLMRDVDEAHSYFRYGFQPNFEDILLKWMEGEKINWLANQFFKKNSSPVTYTMITMEGMLSGFSAWFLYAVWLILTYIYREKRIVNPSCLKSISQLPKYVWYGTTNRRALEIMRLDFSRELLRDDILLMVEKFKDNYIENILNNPEEVKRPNFKNKLLDLKGLRMEEDEFIRVFYKILTEK